MQTTHPHAATPYILMLLCGVIWGMTFSLARIAASGAAHPIGLAFWQALGGGLVMLAYCLIRWRRRRKLGRGALAHVGVIALFGTALPGALFFYAAPRVPAGVLAITVALVPMQTYAVSWLLKIDDFGRRRMLGILLGLLAIIVLMAPESSLPEPGMARWLVLALVATVCYTLEGVYVDVRIPQDADMAGLLTAGLIVAALILTPVAWLEGAFYPIRAPFDRVDLAILTMMVVSSAAYLMFLVVVKMAGAVFASMSGYVITLAGVFWGMLFFSERHSLWVWAALALAMAGMVLVTPRRSTPDIGAHG